ncbi:MAG: hypothetical protein HFH92_06285 [Lachnospiraceae bacterium]|nr:hypothetical protein [uncultured Acetatifactor sp.]MCI8788705.1 hypothetical protein [Lachnospiraceae bacterium]
MDQKETRHVPLTECRFLFLFFDIPEAVLQWDKVKSFIDRTDKVVYHG